LANSLSFFSDIVLGIFSIAVLTTLGFIVFFALVTIFIRLSVSFSVAFNTFVTFSVAVEDVLITLAATFFISCSRGDNTATFFHRLVIFVSPAKSLASVTFEVILGRIAFVNALFFTAHLRPATQVSISNAVIVFDTHLANLLSGSHPTWLDAASLENGFALAFCAICSGVATSNHTFLAALPTFCAAHSAGLSNIPVSAITLGNEPA